MKILQHLTLPQLRRAAEQLGCAVEMVIAVAEVESAPGGPVLDDGRPAILFERHWFHKLTGGRWSKGHPQISSSQTGGYKGGAEEWLRLAAARTLDEDAALMSASWGLFQILGVNHKSAGFETVEDMVAMMSRRKLEGGLRLVPEQLDAFVAFCRSKGLEGPLRREDVVTVARIYNGKGFAANRYDQKLATALIAARKR